MRDKYVAVIDNGELLVHFPGAASDYATLCGLDGTDDDIMVQQSLADTPKGAKVNCSRCIRIFDVAKKYSERDLNRAGAK